MERRRTSGGSFPATATRTIDYEYRTVGAAIVELTETGGLDVFETWIDEETGYLSQINTAARKGSSRPDVRLGWKHAAVNNCTRMTRSEDGGMLANALYTFGAAKAGEARPRAAVGDGPSQTSYGYYEDVEVYSDIQIKAFVDALAAESLLYRKRPKELVHAFPEPGAVQPFQDFDLGDTFSVYAGKEHRGGFSGTQRCYGFDIDLDDEGVETLSAIHTTPE